MADYVAGQINNIHTEQQHLVAGGVGCLQRPHNPVKGPWQQVVVVVQYEVVLSVGALDGLR